MSESNFAIPDSPEFTEAQMERCRETGDYMPIVFEWYKFVGMLAILLGHIMPESQHYYVLMGLLNRCARLILSNVALSHKGKFGETTAIVDRCIFEAALKIIWLCFKKDREEFDRYIGSGLKTKFELKLEIIRNVKERGGVELPIETMLSSIANHISASGHQR